MDERNALSKDAPTKLLRVHEVAEILDVSRARVYELANLKLLPVIRLGRQIRIDPRALRTLIAEGGRSFRGGWRKGE